MSNLEKENQELKEIISAFEGIDLSFIDPNGRVRMIKWGKDYNQWDTDKRLEYAEALASAMNDACRVIQDERNEWLSKAKNLEQQLEQADVQAKNHMQNNINAITKANMDKQELAKTIQKLENQLLAAQKRNDELAKELHLATVNN